MSVDAALRRELLDGIEPDEKTRARISWLEHQVRQLEESGARAAADVATGVNQ